MSTEPLSIKLFLPKGSSDLLRVAEISNWSGKAIACSREELSELCGRDEAGGAGVYFLVGSDPETAEPMVYIGEAEVLGKRLKQHLGKEFWVQVIIFSSKDENLTKAHVKYLEGRLIELGQQAGRATIANTQASGARLPESDQAEMDVFLGKMLRLLPVMGSNSFTPSVSDEVKAKERLVCTIKGLTAYGQRTANGFVVFKGSQAVLESRPSAKRVKMQRETWVKRGVLVPEGGCYIFPKDYEFSSPSIAGSVVQGGNTNGLTAWKNSRGIELKELDEKGMVGIA